MTRRCPACKTVIDDDRLVACPNPQCPSHFSGTTQALPLTKDQIDQLATQLRGPVTWRILKSGWTWLGAISLGLVLLGSSYLTIRARVEEVVTSQIAQRFAEPRIRETFQEVAENRASKMLKEEIQPAVERFRADLKNEYQAVLEEVSRLRIQNNLPILGDQSAFEHDREAFEEILYIAQTSPENSSLKKAAIDELNKVYSKLNARRPFEYLSPPDESIPTTEIITKLSDSDWKVRVHAARLLAWRKQKGVPDILLKVARTDQDIQVVNYALISFWSIIQPMESRRRAAGEEGNSLPQALDLFNIEKLEQWWKENFAEVNERLADMK